MEDLSKNIIATLRESLLVLDSDLRVQIANPAFYRTFQVSPEDVENCFIYDLDNGQWNIPALRDALEEIIQGGDALEDFALEYNFPHIGYKSMMVNARLVERAAGATALVLLAIDDVTEQRRAEATIQTYLHRLEWSNRELEDFAYIASHDLQEPLRAIQAFSDRLQNKHVHSLDDQGIDYLARIQKAAGRMRLLISDLLAYSRVTTQGKPFESVNLSTLAHECSADLSRRLEETKGRIEIGALPIIEADPVQMRQLMQNLFDNGLKFHKPEAAPLVSIASHNKASSQFALPPSFQSQDKYCFLSVGDNGIGFEEKYKDRIFSPFERLHNQSRYPGTGIGLAVCRRIVERHGGTLTAESEPGKGSTFYIVLPLEQPHEPAANLLMQSE